jgi:hypothetical protein
VAANTSEKTTATNGANSLFDFDLNFTPSTIPPAQLTNIQAASSSLHASMSLNKIVETSLYNIDEDKEVESSFQYGNVNTFIKRNSNTAASSPAAINNAILNPALIANAQSGNAANTNGRFTPACFPGRTTPDFRHTTSFFEQQGTRASIVSPLTLNGGSEIIPIAIAFNETIHAYFKTGDASKFKIKCFGCMKISFPFAILKLLAIELPKLEFRLSRLQIANQDLKINSQLLTRPSDGLSESLIDIHSSPSGDASSSLEFGFNNANLIGELKQQHAQNKLAAFFNFELLKYEFKYTSPTAPLTLNAQWSANKLEQTIELNLEYVHSFRKQLSQVNFMIVIPPSSSHAKLSLAQSEPSALVQESDNKLQILWQMPVLNASGKLYAKFKVAQQQETLIETSPSLSANNLNLESFYQPVYVKFHVDNETLSQVKFDILSSNYKLSFLKQTYFEIKLKTYFIF